MTLEIEIRNIMRTVNVRNFLEIPGNEQITTRVVFDVCDVTTGKHLKTLEDNLTEEELNAITQQIVDAYKKN